MAEESSFVAFPFLSEVDVPVVREQLPAGMRLGCVIPAGNFDPPEDHTEDPEFEYVDVLLDDYSDVNDDVGTLFGVRQGHFRQSLDWRPKRNRDVTTSIAVVAPGPWYTTEVLEKASIRELAEVLTNSEYDAIALECQMGDDEEFNRCVEIAREMQRWTALPIAHVGGELRSIETTPFAMTIKRLR